MASVQSRTHLFSDGLVRNCLRGLADLPAKLDGSRPKPTLGALDIFQLSSLSDSNRDRCVVWSFVARVYRGNRAIPRPADLAVSSPRLGPGWQRTIPLALRPRHPLRSLLLHRPPIHPTPRQIAGLCELDLPMLRGRSDESVNSPERSEWHERFTTNFYG